MIEFHYNFPTRIIFGENKIDEISNLITPFGNKVLIICGSKSNQASGTLERLQKLLTSHNISFTVFEGVTTNPTEEIIKSGATKLKESKSDLIISIGGGSVHDAAKAINLSLSHEDKLIDYTVTGKHSVPGIKNELLPLITIPTITGTGAEISPASLVRLNLQKHIIFSPFLFPFASIYDISVMTCSERSTISKVGIDAFFQGLEAYLAKNSNPFSDKFALEAIKNSILYLPALSKQPDDLKAKSYVALSALDSLLGVSNSGVGAIHALSDPLSGRYNIHHGVAQTIVAKGILSYYKSIKLPKLKLLEDELVKLITPLHKSFPKDIIAQYEWFLEKLDVNITEDLEILRAKKVDMYKLTEESQNPDMATAPVELTSDIIENIFHNSIK
ncbi:hypothetical protein DF185_10725 [Marinifilum breve]|uniref:Uncharacterized protein n=1 Tax=Marinifilum breve TaxID=2184082 RepID=A0A2V3ZXR8_9BACT|nr:iron-containing alcohol dehydrogenase [Marinifilum breve]PXY01116.1 hypothetical protein DF185_10725 [Marinifilum breve]